MYSYSSLKLNWFILEQLETIIAAKEQDCENISMGERTR